MGGDREGADLEALDNYALKRHIDHLRAKIRRAEVALWQRTAVRLATFPPAWADPSSAGLVLPEPAAAEYTEVVHDHLARVLPPQCRGGPGYPWGELWGPPDALGPNPQHRLRELIAWAHDQARGQLVDPEPWR